MAALEAWIAPLLCALAALSALIGVAQALPAWRASYERHVLGSARAELERHFIAVAPRRYMWWPLAIGVAAASLGGWIGGIAGALLGVGAVAALAWRARASLTERRRRRLVLQLPDGLRAIASSLRSGAHLSRALELAARTQRAPLGQELAVILGERRLGRSIDQAIAGLARRYASRDLELLAAAVALAQGTGGRLATALESLAETLRERLRVEERLRAMTATGRMQGWIATALPVAVALALYAQDPVAMQMAWHEPWGRAAFAIAFLMVAVAGLMIKRIMRIDV